MVINFKRELVYRFHINNVSGLPFYDVIIVANRLYEVIRKINLAGVFISSL